MDATTSLSVDWLAAFVQTMATVLLTLFSGCSDIVPSWLASRLMAVCLSLLPSFSLLSSLGVLLSWASFHFLLSEPYLQVIQSEPSVKHHFSAEPLKFLPLAGGEAQWSQHLLTMTEALSQIPSTGGKNPNCHVWPTFLLASRLVKFTFPLGQFLLEP